MALVGANALHYAIAKVLHRERAILTVRLCQDQFSNNNQGETLIGAKQLSSVTFVCDTLALGEFTKLA